MASKATRSTTRRNDPAAANLLSEVTLRAVADGSTALVLCGNLAASSRLFTDVLSSCTTGDEIPLPGKTKVELDLLVAWLGREEKHTKVLTGAL